MSFNSLSPYLFRYDHNYTYHDGLVVAYNLIDTTISEKRKSYVLGLQFFEGMFGRLQKNACAYSPLNKDSIKEKIYDMLRSQAGR
ncbi:hypothetical protein TrispH2_002389 [Trichoplax sp. H2]|nr:hypothetical protein TrispH2_002389 [Trichoplax sp. H2]|eukprot:RDD44915.1 hypothetical protein TrispH2_002389 [Trichoplax sp. H2]